MDYLSTWCDIIGGELLDGIEWDEIADTGGRIAVVRVRPFRIGFGVGTILTTAINMGADLAAHFYKAQFSGPCHQPPTDDLTVVDGSICLLPTSATRMATTSVSFENCSTTWSTP